MHPISAVSRSRRTPTPLRPAVTRTSGLSRAMALPPGALACCHLIVHSCTRGAASLPSRALGAPSPAFTTSCPHAPSPVCTRRLAPTPCFRVASNASAWRWMPLHRLTRPHAVPHAHVPCASNGALGTWALFLPRRPARLGIALHPLVPCHTPLPSLTLCRHRTFVAAPRRRAVVTRPPLWHSVARYYTPALSTHRRPPCAATRRHVMLLRRATPPGLVRRSLLLCRALSCPKASPRRPLAPHGTMMRRRPALSTTSACSCAALHPQDLRTVASRPVLPSRTSAVSCHVVQSCAPRRLLCPHAAICCPWLLSVMACPM
ncbi:hypothetical protein DENSPDRAFT_886767 [Dentipellis sp. KUC8613]|nr:hypothetical protein DENSPDRAFT_886767 [Dentipellis sp. KUC8613]